MIGPLIASQFAMPQFETWAQLAVGRVINSLPEGLLIALFAWAVLRMLPKQNSRTKFAVWFLALMAVVGIACLGGIMLRGSQARSWPHPAPLPTSPQSSTCPPTGQSTFLPRGSWRCVWP